MKNKTTHQQLGFVGEELATNYLKKHGYKIIQRNFRKRYGDIDIIAWDCDTLVFVEVKLRTNEIFGQPEEMFSEKKIDRLVKSAEYYKFINNLTDIKIRLDAILIYCPKNSDECKIKHYQNISA